MKSPFQFLDYFDKEDKDSFFGRKEENKRLYQLVNHHRLTLIYGPSGTGKTSLVRCGLANSFHATEWLPIFIKRQQNINDSLIVALRDRIREDRDYFDTVEDPVTLLDEVTTQFLRPVYLIFDQLEELFINGSEAEQAQFTENIHEIMKAGLSCRLIFILREEYLGRLYGFEQRIPILYEQRLRVDPLSAPVIREQVIGKSFSLFNLSLASAGMEDKIIHNLQGQKNIIPLPYLQVYLDQLWQHCAQEQGVTYYTDTNYPALTITDTSVEELGNLNKVFENYLLKQRALIQQDMDERPLGKWQRRLGPSLPQNLVAKIIDGLATDDGTKRSIAIERVAGDQFRVVNPPAEWSALKWVHPDTLVYVLQQLAAVRLLRIETESIELAHDSLAEVIDRQRTTEQRELNLLRQQIRSSHQLFQKTGDYLSENKLALYEDRIQELGISEAQEAHFRASKEHWEAKREEELLKAKSQNSLLAKLVSLCVVSLIAVGFLLLGIRRQNGRLDASKIKIQEQLIEKEKQNLAQEAITKEAQEARDDANDKAREARLQQDAAERSEARANSLAIEGQKLAATLNSDFDELITAGFQEYDRQNFDNALTYWANARFLRPNDERISYLIEACEDTIEAEDSALSGKWGKATKLFRKLIRDKGNISSFNGFASLRLRNLTETEMNWNQGTNVVRSKFGYLEKIHIDKPILSLPAKWDVEDDEIRYLSVKTIGGKLFNCNRFPNLVSINLSFSDVTNLDGLSHVESFGEIILSNSAISDVSALSNLTALAGLNISSTNVTDLSPLSNLKYLGYLDLSYSKEVDLSPLQHLDSLGDLNLSNSGVSNLAGLQKISKIGDINLLGSKVSSLMGLSGVKTIGRLNLSGTSVETFEGLSNLITMGDLILGSNYFSNENLKSLKGLSNLKQIGDIDLRYTNVTSLDGLTKLKKVDNLFLNSKIPNLNPLGNLVSVKHLDLSFSLISSLEPLINLTYLGRLDLYECPVEDLSPLTRLDSLVEIDLRESNVRDLHPLLNIASIGKIIVVEGQFTEEHLEPIRKKFLGVISVEKI